MAVSPWIWLILGWQGLVYANENAERATKYDTARTFANLRGKPLLVVGGPTGSPLNKALNMPNHGYGDVVYDIDPGSASGLPSNARFVQGDVRDMHVFRDKVFGAAFVSHVLEHLSTVEDAETALRELNRVADAVFVAGPGKQGLRNWLHSEHHLWVNQHNDGQVVIEAR